MISRIDTSPENIQKLKELGEKNTLKEVARLTGRSVEGIRDFLIRHDALPENRKVRYRKAAAKKYTVEPKRCVDCGKQLFWAKIYSHEDRCQRCGHKKYFDELRASKPKKVRKAIRKTVKKFKAEKAELNTALQFSKKIVDIDERLMALNKKLKKAQKELDFNIC